MEVLHSLNDFFLKPIDYINEAPQQNGIPKYEEISFSQSAVNRLLFLAQLISSIIALPILLIVGLVEATIEATRQNPTEKIGFASLSYILKLHALAAIPISFVGIFAPFSTVAKCRESSQKCLGPPPQGLFPTNDQA